MGTAGQVEVKAPRISLSNRSEISSSTAGKGDAGEVTLEATENLSISASEVSSAVESGGVGQAGRVSLTATSISVSNRSEISSSTAGQGDAGNIDIRADQVTIQEDSEVSATTSGGDGGSITVTAKTFEANSGGQLRTTTSGSQDAGDITLFVLEEVTLAGKGSGLFANTTPGSTGNGGNIFVDPRVMIVRDGAGIAVDSRGTGEGGSIEIISGSLTLDNGAFISAETASNTGGNITLQVQDLLLLRRNSRISTTAGTAGAGGDGGNITIDAKFIIAVPSENSDITANAFEGRGGKINITTQGIFGLESRDSLTPLSDITASSEFGVDGIIEINRPNVDPTKELVEFPEEPINIARLIDQNLCSAGQGSEFTVTSRGGLPDSPNQTLKPDAAWEDWRIEESSEQEVESQQSVPVQTPASTPEQATSDRQQEKIVEFRGWAINARGNLVLTAEPNTVTPKGVLLPPAGCQQLTEKLSFR